MICDCKKLTFDYRLSRRDLKYKNKSMEIRTPKLTSDRFIAIYSINEDFWLYRQGYLLNECNEIDEDVYCKHGQIYLTVDQLEDLEFILMKGMETTLNYLYKIGFYKGEQNDM